MHVGYNARLSDIGGASNSIGMDGNEDKTVEALAWHERPTPDVKSNVHAHVDIDGGRT